MTDQNPELVHLWEQAVDEYLSDSERDSDAHRWKVPITTPSDLETLIKRHESEFTKFRNSRRKYWNALMVTVRHLQNLGSVAQAALQLSPFAPAAVITEAILFLASSGTAVADSYDALETLFRRVQDITTRMEMYLTGTIDMKLQRIVVRLLVAFLGVFGEAQAAIKRGRAKEMMRRLGGKENKIQAALDRLDELVEVEVALVAAGTYSTTKRIDEKVDDERAASLLRRSLCASSAADNQGFGEVITSSRLSRSGDWIIDEQLYDRWFKMEFPVLWILGKPGTGKTYLASRILSHIEQSSHIASAFYIREGMNVQHTPEVILKALAYQVTETNPMYRRRAIGICRDGSSLLLPETIWDNLFIEPFTDETMGPIFIIIDGLDEATPPNQELLVRLAKKLSDLRYSDRQCANIQMLVLGRPELDYVISNIWRGEKRRPKILPIQSSMTDSDVRRFITKAVDDGIPILQKLRPERSKRLRKTIIKTLSRSSDGMFMLAKLMLAEVKDMNKPELIQQALAKPPRGLDDMFNRVVARLDIIGGFDKNDLNEIIMWVACAQRDLLLGELDLILKVRDIRQNGIIGLEDELNTRFGSFFSIISAQIDMDLISEQDEDNISVNKNEDISDLSSDSEASGISEDLSDGAWEIESTSDHTKGNDFSDEEDDAIPASFFLAKVRFSHASVGQHFRTAPPHKEIGMSLNFAQAHIALTCSRFLTETYPKKKNKPWREPTLFEYSVNHFLDHLAQVDFTELKASNAIIFDSLSKEVQLLFRDRAAISRWFHALSDEYRFMCQLFSTHICSRLRVCVPDLDLIYTTDAMTLKEDARTNSSFMQLLLKPFVHYVLEAWLKLQSCDPMLAVMFLHGYDSLRDEPNNTGWYLPPDRPFQHIAESIAPDEIRKMASIGNLEMDAGFHTALGSTFAKINTQQHLLSAVEEFDKAISLSKGGEQLWSAYIAKANVLAALFDHEGVIMAASTAMDLLPDHRTYSKREILKLIANANLNLENTDVAYKAALQAHRAAEYDVSAAFHLIFTGHKSGIYTETVRMADEATKDSTKAQLFGSILTAFIPERYTTDYFAVACAKVGNIDLARDAFQVIKHLGLSQEDRHLMAAADAALARLYFSFYRDEQKAIALWEANIKEYPNMSASLDGCLALMPLYYDKAHAASPSEVGSWVSKMQNLVDLIEPMSFNTEYYPTKYDISALLGKWFADRNEHDQARNIIRPMVKEAIQKLTDREEYNDYEAYSDLGRALLCFGDRKNAAISWAFTKPLRAVQEISHTQMDWDKATAPAKYGDNTINGSVVLTGRCDGLCNRMENTFQSFSFCEICTDTAFCEECLRSLKQGKATYRICDPKHPMIEVYPPKGLVTKDQEGYKIHTDEEKPISLGTWLDRMRREWVEL